MDFLTEDVVKDLNLTETQVTALKEKGGDYVATIKQQFEGKANTDAQGIINGALAKVAEVTGVPQKDKEKAATYIARAGEEFVTAKVATAQAEYDRKLKEFDGNTATKAELDKAKQALDDAQKKLAGLDELTEKATKYDTLITENLQLKRSTAYTSVKPAFPATVNAYEAAAKWGEFQRATEELYNIEIVDGEAMAIDKTNPHKIVKLKDLVSKDVTLAALLTGRQQGGSGASVVKSVTVEGVPFEIPESATRAEIRVMVQDYLTTKKGIKATSPEYSKAFGEIWSKIPASK